MPLNSPEGKSSSVMMSDSGGRSRRVQAVRAGVKKSVLKINKYFLYVGILKLVPEGGSSMIYRFTCR